MKNINVIEEHQITGLKCSGVRSAVAGKHMTSVRVPESQRFLAYLGIALFIHPITHSYMVML